MKIYSPSQLTMHQFCGTARQLSNQGWKTKYMSPLDIAKFVGTAVAKGLEVYHNLMAMSTMTENGTKILVYQAAIKEYNDEFDHHINSGRILGQIAQTSHLGATERIKQFLQLGIDQQPLKDWTILHTELRYNSGARADIVGLDPDGVLSILDYKCMTEFPQRKQYTKYFNSQFNGNQAMSYKYNHELDFKEHVEKFYICLLTLTPFEVKVEGKVYDPRRYELWLDSAQVEWLTMEVEDKYGDTPTENATHENEWGQCDYYDACIHMGRDVDLMQQSYVQVKRRDK